MSQSNLSDELRKMASRMSTTNSVSPKPATLCASTCEICGGVGYIRYDVDRSDYRFGKIFPCPNIPKDKRHIIHPCGLYMDDMDNLSLDKIEPYPVEVLYKNKILKTNMHRVAEVIQEYLQHGFGFVYLYGQYGRGKSLLIQHFVAKYISLDVPSLYLNASDILDLVKDGFDQTDPRESALRRINHINTIPVLAIDEFDKVNITEWAAERLFHIVNNRYEGAMHQSSITLIASNRKPDEISRGIASRVLDGRCLYLEIQGEDIRPKMSWDEET